MKFEESINPLTDFLTDNDFLVKRKSACFVEYSSNSATITVAYANLESLFYTSIGQNLKSLIELTPIVVEQVFKDNGFHFQSTLTVSDLISFLKGAGKPVLTGDKKMFEELKEFSGRISGEYTKEKVQLQFIQRADKAWLQKDYANFIKYIDKSEKTSLPQSYLKKYKIAEDLLRKGIE